MKKIIAILLTLIILIATFTTVSSAYNGFADIRESDWYYYPVLNAWMNEYVAGMINEKGERVFRPNDTLTRAQFMQMLAQSTGDMLNDTYYKNVDLNFEDVKTSHWYNAAIAWGVEKGIVKGVSETRFAPNDPITREQVARMLCLFAEYKGYNMDYTDDLSAFTDADTISDWALTQMQWAVASEIIKGYGDGELRPRRNTTRAEICVMLEALETYFNYDGPAFRDGVFAAICDHVITNGEDSSVDRDMEWSVTKEDATLNIRCTKDKSFIAINYTKENADGIKESLYFNIYALTDHYSYTYDQRIAKEDGTFDFPYIIGTDLTLEGFTNYDYILSSPGDPEEEQWQALHEEFMTIFTELLESLEYTYEDLFR